MGRPRGFIENWTPTAPVADLIDQVALIINTSDILPLTLRQIFYMLVSNSAYDKTEKAYKRLCETMNKARRARMIDMHSIRDDGLTRVNSAGYRSGESFISTVKWRAENFKLDRQSVQDVKLYLWCEAGGMVPQLADAVEEWHIPVLSSGGFDSVTTKHNLASELSAAGAVVVLHLGDHDPSGVHMFGSLDEDLQAFISAMSNQGWGGQSFDMERIAVTPQQVEDMHLPTAPAKATDRRSFTGLTTQCEAIPPSELRVIVRDKVLEYLDLDAHEGVISREADISERLMAKLGEIEF